MLTKTAIGRAGEDLVMRYLEQNGYHIRTHNYRTQRGEIDIIAERGETLAFVEVKTRQTATFELSTVITPSKKRRIFLAARSYCIRYQTFNRSLRFDVAVVVFDRTPPITYYENAFTEDDHG
jgi:putative endonuclease